MQLVFKACKRLFAALPLAACIAGKVLVLHGGERSLFLSPRAMLQRVLMFVSSPQQLFPSNHTSHSCAGLFRKPEAVAKSKKRRRKPVSAAVDDVALGSLADLRNASKGGMDPSGVLS